MEIHIVHHPVVGTVRWKAENEVSGAPITLLDGYVEKNISSVNIPSLIGVIDGTVDHPKHKFDGNLKFYQPGITQLLAVFEEISTQGFDSRIISFDGSFNPRLIKRPQGGAVHTASNHAFGTAIDINADLNKQGHSAIPASKKGSVVDLVPIFERHGFKWGEHFPIKDPMHFELAKILETVN